MSFVYINQNTIEIINFFFKFQLDTPGFGMPGRKYYLKSRNDTKLKAYEKLAVEMAIQMGADPKQAQKDMGDIVDLEINLANVRHILM